MNEKKCPYEEPKIEIVSFVTEDVLRKSKDIEMEEIEDW